MVKYICGEIRDPARQLTPQIHMLRYILSASKLYPELYQNEYDDVKWEQEVE